MHRFDQPGVTQREHRLVQGLRTPCSHQLHTHGNREHHQEIRTPGEKLLRDPSGDRGRSATRSTGSCCRPELGRSPASVNRGLGGKVDTDTSIPARAKVKIILLIRISAKMNHIFSVTIFFGESTVNIAILPSKIPDYHTQSLTRTRGNHWVHL